jgi:apolipoprotein N-acyltransferase
MTPLIQVASVTGVYGVSFLIIWVSLSLLSAALMTVRRPTSRSVWVAELFLPVLLTAVLFNLGFRQINRQPPVERTLRVMLVQPSIPQTLIWDPNQDTNRFNQLVEYTAGILTNKSDVVIWPESAVPKMLRYDTNTFNAITKLARDHGVWMIIGSDDAELRRGSGNQDEAHYFNSSFLVSPDGHIRERYIKRNLVIFGEYVPLRRWLPFLKWFTPVEGGFTAGTGPVEFNLEELEVKTAVLICFEDVFPQLARLDVKPDTDFLVNITNDGWFGESAAQWQQAATGLFRAVENRVPLIRCCNNGLTCWIDGYGRIREILRDQQGKVYGQGYLRAEIPILGPGQTHALTFYTKHGDIFGWGCLGISSALLVFRFLTRRNGQHWRSGNVPQGLDTKGMR